ncbi:MAG: hypothetical protein IK997_02050 [Bacilli bacterium]|nr:hypothetical protein [Bacilli bacterium]
MDNKDYEILISKYYDLDVDSKRKELFEELDKTKKILDIVLQFQNNPNSNELVDYTENSSDSESDNLVKLYNNVLMIQESLITYLRDKGY